MNGGDYLFLFLLHGFWCAQERSLDTAGRSGPATGAPTDRSIVSAALRAEGMHALLYLRTDGRAPAKQASQAKPLRSQNVSSEMHESWKSCAAESRQKANAESSSQYPPAAAASSCLICCCWWWWSCRSSCASAEPSSASPSSTGGRRGGLLASSSSSAADLKMRLRCGEEGREGHVQMRG